MKYGNTSTDVPTLSARLAAAGASARSSPPVLEPCQPGTSKETMCHPIGEHAHARCLMSCPVP